MKVIYSAIATAVGLSAMSALAQDLAKQLSNLIASLNSLPYFCVLPCSANVQDTEISHNIGKARRRVA